MSNKEAAERIVQEGHCDNVLCKNCPLNIDEDVLEAKNDCTSGNIVEKATLWLTRLKEMNLFKSGAYQQLATAACTSPPLKE